MTSPYISQTNTKGYHLDIELFDTRYHFYDMLPYTLPHMLPHTLPHTLPHMLPHMLPLSCYEIYHITTRYHTLPSTIYKSIVYTSFLKL